MLVNSREIPDGSPKALRLLKAWVLASKRQQLTNEVRSPRSQSLTVETWGQGHPQYFVQISITSMPAAHSVRTFQQFPTRVWRSLELDSFQPCRACELVRNMRYLCAILVCHPHTGPGGGSRACSEGLRSSGACADGLPHDKLLQSLNSGICFVLGS